MWVAFDPQDPNAFASASLEGTIKIWNVHSSMPKFTSHARGKGLNFVDHFSRDDMLYLLSGSNDYTAKVWAEAVYKHSRDTSTMLLPYVRILICQ